MLVVGEGWQLLPEVFFSFYSNLYPGIEKWVLTFCKSKSITKQHFLPPTYQWWERPLSWLRCRWPPIHCGAKQPVIRWFYTWEASSPPYQEVLQSRRPGRSGWSCWRTQQTSQALPPDASQGLRVFRGWVKSPLTLRWTTWAMWGLVDTWHS